MNTRAHTFINKGNRRQLINAEGMVELENHYLTVL